MAGRPRKGVTPENAWDVRYYFSNALKDNERARLLMEDGERAPEALRELGGVTEYRWCPLPNDRQSVYPGKPLPDPEELDVWLLRWITRAGWLRCQNNLNQRQYALRTRHGTKNFRMSLKNWEILKTIARDKRLTLDDALAEILEEYR